MGFGTNRTLPVMFAERDALQMQAAGIKTKLAELNTEIAAATAPLATAAYQKAEKVDGSVKFAQGDTIFKAEIDKTVKWDSAALFDIAASMPWAEAGAIFKFELSVGEKIYKALPDGDVKTRITAARSVKYGDPKISVA